MNLPEIHVQVSSLKKLTNVQQNILQLNGVQFENSSLKVGPKKGLPGLPMFCLPMLTVFFMSTAASRGSWSAA